MKSKITISIILILICTILISCTETKKADDSKATQDAIQETVNANNQFTIELYKQLKQDENVFFSPFSIETALAMTAEGANGETFNQIQNTLHFPKDKTKRTSSFAKLINQINKNQNEYQLSTANALWAQKEFPFNQDYFNTVETYYLGKATNLDFQTQTETSRVTINNWVEKQTNQKIKDLIPKGMLDPSTRLVLTNAIYFKGDWLNQFNKENTKKQDFKVNPEKTIQVNMMHLNEDGEFNYAETSELQILELQYSGEELSMLIFLPTEITNFESQLTIENINQWKQSLTPQKVNIYLPKFKVETKYQLKETLTKLGMPTPFSNAADFSKMSSEKLSISEVIHQAFVEVNEEGTEAAAATAVVMKLTAIPDKRTFKADHPFVFVIQQKQTGNILFMGKVSNPTI